MKILGREEVWIHTHFLTDCTRLPAFRMREIIRDMTPFLRKVGIVYGVHFTQLQNERICRIVLACVPLPQTLDRIQRKLQEVVLDIPARPPVTTVTTTDTPMGQTVSAKRRLSKKG